jgi:thiosulfate reductase cytochrome b subunit
MEAATIIYRHSLATRVMHWVNAFCVVVVLMSGLQIFNAHPRLYWGQYGANADRAFLALSARQTQLGVPIGILRIGSFEIRTTGVLGVSAGVGGQPSARGFPQWATIPSWQDLATGRRWHFFFAWVLVINSASYLIVSVASGHLRRELVPARAELSAANLGRETWDHFRLKFPQGVAAKHYNVLQKLSYLAVIFVLAPMMVGTGLTMSPGADAAMPWLLDLFGGRQSARSLHFISAMLIVMFILVHVAMVILAGPWNELRSMITGRYTLPSRKLK